MTTPPSDPSDPPNGLPEARRRRLARLSAGRDVPRPAALEPREGRGLRARAAATDRAARFDERLEQVRRDTARRAVVQRRLELATTLGILAGGALVWVVAGTFVATGPALAIGIAAMVAMQAARVVGQRLARRRGADAWDWQAGRHRLFGQPAARVQKADAPPASDPRRR